MSEVKLPMSFFTPKQKKVWDYIKSYHKDNSYPPTYEEIRVHMKYKYVGQVSAMIQKLKEKGYVDNTPGVARSLYAKDVDSIVVRLK
jgi:SOS-response transcriptional repressor LexA